MPVLSWTGTRFVFVCNPGDAPKARQAGFHFDPHNSLWWTGLIPSAKQLESYADEKAIARFNQDQNIVSQSWAMSSDIYIPVPDGLSYLGFQKAGIEYTSKRRNTLIGDQMGLGKSIEALGVINLFPEIKSVLIIPPASLRLNWGKEAKKWLVRDLTGGYAYSDFFPDTNIVIINYDIIKKFREHYIDKRLWDLVIFDESHYLKNSETQRTRACLGYDFYGKDMSEPIDAGMRIFMTGTPILNKPIDLYPTLRVADPNGLGSSLWGFAERYCKPWEPPWGGGMEYNGADNLDELQERLRSSVMVRRLKKDVLKELPPKRRQVVAIPAGPANAAIKKELDFYIQHEKEIESALERADKDQFLGDEGSYRQAVLGLDGKAPTFTQMSLLRKQTAVAKIPFAIEFIDNILEQEEKIVIFAHHHEVIDKIHEHYSRIALKMHGGTNITDRQHAVDQFQEDEKCRIIIGSIGAMGVGWTLTASAYCLFIELDWVPSNITQAEDREHRIGQLGCVLIHHLCFDGSLDAYMAQKIIAKQDIIDKALDT